MLVSSITNNILITMFSPTINPTHIHASKENDIIEIMDSVNHEVVGINFIDVNRIFNDQFVSGPIVLDDAQVKILNVLLTKEGFDIQLAKDDEPKFVIGHVISMEAHPNSDHLHIIQVNIGKEKPIQLVSGSPNMRENINVVVVRPGAIMPSGQVIWPGELRGTFSEGMVASARELAIKNAPNKPGALVLPSDFQPIGESADFKKIEDLLSNG